jgi:hypothetical protein
MDISKKELSMSWGSSRGHIFRTDVQARLWDTLNVLSLDRPALSLGKEARPLEALGFFTCKL